MLSELAYTQDAMRHGDAAPLPHSLDSRERALLTLLGRHGIDLKPRSAGRLPPPSPQPIGSNRGLDADPGGNARARALGGRSTLLEAAGDLARAVAAATSEPTLVSSVAPNPNPEPSPEDPGPTSASIHDAIQAFVNRLSEVLPGARWATLTPPRRADADCRTEPLVVSDPAAAAIDALEELAGDGPRHEAARTRCPIRVVDLRADPRWAGFAELASSGTSEPAATQEEWAGPEVRAVLIVPIPGGPVRSTSSSPNFLAAPRHQRRSSVPAPMATMNLYSPQVGAFQHILDEECHYLADLLGLALAAKTSSDTAHHLTLALASNRAIAAAVGICMATRRCTYTAAFDHLVTISQNCNRKLADIAEEVLLTGAIPPLTVFVTTPRELADGCIEGRRLASQPSQSELRFDVSPDPRRGLVTTQPPQPSQPAFGDMHQAASDEAASHSSPQVSHPSDAASPSAGLTCSDTLHSSAAVAAKSVPGPPLQDDQLHEEIELLLDVIVTASEHRSHLSAQQVDDALHLPRNGSAQALRADDEAVRSL
ncbi:ANTAR domain-containing protein [Terrabacter terrigena]|uniref:ANTAR domain-containing protein n=1 Tax=Terrabacter terrigena TaxID=574718 RepID=A0ABW3N395_9MICO